MAPKLPSSLSNASAALLLAAAAALPCTAHAAAWPERPITIIVPGAPGGTTDIPTRLVAQKLSAILGQPVVVDNKPGSGGIIGTQAFMRAAPDGYTLLVGNTGSHAINYSAYKQLSYQPQDFLPLTDLISFANVLVVGAQAPVRSVAELVAQLKQSPGKYSYASAGIGQTTHLTAELFRLRTGTEVIHVPYKGSTPATTSVLAGETTFMFDNLTQALPQIRAGKLRALAVTSAERLPALPEVPTMAQAGIKDFVVMGWLGFFAPAKTPPAVAAALQEALGKAMRDAEVAARFRDMGGTPGGEPQPKFAALVRGEIQRWGETIRASKVSLD
ncbi:Bug family tripartite tricarboxylate transporter substrate binding protein [Cupriavidus alkaliphilus]|uniref:Tripartite-type tricarboxylate transporter receptor subunit TctC n=1 Tax=Cupriavidus alkaliphilus TaxID=942866 RepID=A0A7W4V7R4_9BURK|nr:tripartite tricarboxylate transporter substrate binding protein [Cupriavidus alkaliphilus]MBB3006635.1 tripartite-type tricarboxylate transporter receptor subunit TctC [Cupriavidus alkaliphilus]PVY67582.1 tripartite-type tricarboxylate transporter receptor subunit TctC [Cupriavidus alkaliphilus]SCB37031.1 Tripartite-type tricarboxylate transporter, receptor component TctC [Cupriavidus alkaliphilus]